MKWLHFLLLLVLSAFFILNGCCSTKKTEQTTVTVTRVDTLLKVKVDTATVIKTVTLHDTAKIETRYAKAISYFDQNTHKIVLKFAPRQFDIHIIMNHRQEKTVTTSEPVKKRTSPLILALFWVLGFIGGISLSKALKL